MDCHLRVWRLLLSIRLSLTVLPKAGPTAPTTTTARRPAGFQPNPQR